MCLGVSCLSAVLNTCRRVISSELLDISFAKFGQAQSWRNKLCSTIPKCSMHGIFTHIYPKNQPNVGKYSIHGASGTGFSAGSLFQHRKLPTESHLEKKNSPWSHHAITQLFNQPVRPPRKKTTNSDKCRRCFQESGCSKRCLRCCLQYPTRNAILLSTASKKRMKSIEILENYWNILQPSTQNCTTGVTALPVC